MRCEVGLHRHPESLFFAWPTHNQQHFCRSGKPILQIFLVANIVEAVLPLPSPRTLSRFTLNLKNQVLHLARLAVADFDMSVDTNFGDGGPVPPIADLLY